MKRFALAVSCSLVVLAATADAQQPTDVRPPTDAKKPIMSSEGHMSLGQLTPTPEMWFYDQAMRAYADPRVAVRRNAEQASIARHQRLAASQWYGVSNARPTTNVTPFVGGQYSPSWVGSNRYPAQWTPRTPATVVLQPNRAQMW